MKKILQNLMLLAVASLVTVVLAEFAARLVLDPVDYLKPNMLYDPVLGLRIEPGTAGHDDWGFRNREVPDDVAVLALGDSNTYGVSAPAKWSWPSQLSSQLGEPVYQLALGGFGPLQYEYLLKQYGERLKPELVVIGFYYGNDLDDVYRMVYSLDAWSHLRVPGMAPAEADFVVETEADKRGVFLEDFRGWLSGRSVIYRILTYSVIGNLTRMLEQDTRQAKNPDIVAFVDEENDIRTTFTPHLRHHVMDLSRERIREGLRQALLSIERMQQWCAERDIPFLVAIIPNKETVFGDYIRRQADVPEYTLLNKLVDAEELLDKKVKAYLDSRGIAHVSTLPALKAALGKRQIYRQDEDGHPIREGYAIIAEQVANHYRQVVKSAP